MPRTRYSSAVLGTRWSAAVAVLSSSKCSKSGGALTGAVLWSKLLHSGSRAKAELGSCLAGWGKRENPLSLAFPLFFFSCFNLPYRSNIVRLEKYSEPNRLTFLVPQSSDRSNDSCFVKALASTPSTSTTSRQLNAEHSSCRH